MYTLLFHIEIIVYVYVSSSHCTKFNLRNSTNTRVPSVINYVDDIHITLVCWGYVMLCFQLSLYKISLTQLYHIQVPSVIVTISSKFANINTHTFYSMFIPCFLFFPASVRTYAFCWDHKYKFNNVSEIFNQLQSRNKSTTAVVNQIRSFPSVLLAETEAEKKTMRRRKRNCFSLGSHPPHRPMVVIDGI